MKPIYGIRILILIVALVISTFRFEAKGNEYSYDGNVQLPSSVTYGEIQQDYGRPNLRADGVDEPELGGIDAPDPTVPVGDGLIPILIAGTAYGIILIYKKKKYLFT